ATCDGHVLLAPYDSSRTTLSIDGNAVALEVGRATCRQTIPFTLAVDEERATLDARPEGSIACLPEACGDMCGVDAAGIGMSLVAAATFVDDRLVLTSSDPAGLLAHACEAAGGTP